MGIFPTREAIQKSLGFETANKQPTNVQHYAVTFILFFVILGIAVAVKSLGTVYSVVGGFSATTLAYILPAASYLVTRNAYYKNLEEQKSTPSNIIGVFPTLTGTTTITPDETDLKAAALLWDTNSIASSSKIFDDDVATVDGDAMGEPELLIDKALKPSLFMNCAAVLLILTGFVVMFFSLSAAIKG